MSNVNSLEKKGYRITIKQKGLNSLLRTHAKIISIFIIWKREKLKKKD